MLPDTENITKRYDPNRLKFALEHYPDKDPDIYLNDFFHVKYITAYLTNIFSTLYSGYLEYPPDKIRDLLMENFHFRERQEFSTDLWRYIFSTVEKHKTSLGQESKEKFDLAVIKATFIPKLVDFFKLFLRNHLLMQADMFNSDQYENYLNDVNDYSGYYFLDIACHEFAIEKTFTLRGYLRHFEQDTIEIYGVQNAIMGMEDYHNESYEFEVEKANYRKFKKKLDRVMDEYINVRFKVIRIQSPNQNLGPNYTQGKILGFV